MEKREKTKISLKQSLNDILPDLTINWHIFLTLVLGLIIVVFGK